MYESFVPSSSITSVEPSRYTSTFRLVHGKRELRVHKAGSRDREAKRSAVYNPRYWIKCKTFKGWPFWQPSRTEVNMTETSIIADPAWIVYMIECEDRSLYTGITTDLAKRFDRHRSAKGAKFFNSRRAVKLVYAETGFDRSGASKREYAIKQMTRAEKLGLIASEGNKIAAIDFRPGKQTGQSVL